MDEIEKLMNDTALWLGLRDFMEEVKAPKLAIFWTRGVAWEAHTVINVLGKQEKCMSRIMRIFYPWKYSTCRTRCYADYHDAIRRGLTPPDPKCSCEHLDDSYTIVPDLYYCIDCTQVGVHRTREDQEHPCTSGFHNFTKGKYVKEEYVSGNCSKCGLQFKP